ncbi:nitronate monooxygenase [Corynebacterium aquatimens]|uniref:NAD(P)H-dependent flavin oxidoreductase n=1 Tax=Corynebacterium TaxID=1716 RepID=UPI001F1B77BA|nr:MULTISPECIES: nitronate monooxygenase [Corynebacterium]QYH20016.1 nitronate monooxygenase [Corynebacterium aquatimens]UIZ92787.1 nitronate monooxygenase [Corynebacterium sp. CNCTC7651]
MPVTLPRAVAAPMAGGPTTPALVNAVTFGFLALGTCSAAEAREWLAACRAPFGANLFLPQPEPLLADVHSTATKLNKDIPKADATSGFAEKFAAVLEVAPAIVSSTFGCFTDAQIAQLHEFGSEAWATVTTTEEAETAITRGIDGLIVQGPLAGGHRGTWSPTAEPGTDSLETLLGSIIPLGKPVIAAGGVRSKADVDKLLALGATSVACGTAFLLAREAGTSARNRELLRSSRPDVLSRAFSGRWARGIETEFTRTHPDLPWVYPYLRPMTSENDYCLVGADRGELMEAPAADIETMLSGY